MKTPLMSCVAAALTIVGLANAQTKDPWIGKRVITHYGTVLRVGNQVVDDETRGTHLNVSGRDRKLVRVYRVEQVNGNWLWLKAEKEGLAGWVQSAYVIPYDQAIDYYTDQIRANPNNGRSYDRRGNIWYKKGEYDLAIADHNEAIRLEPSYEVAWNNRGNSWGGKKDYEKAIADYTEAIRLNPKFFLAFHNRGDTWLIKQEYDKAIADFTEAIRLDPKDASAHVRRAFAWNVKKEYDKAIDDCTEAIRLDPTDAFAHYCRGRALQEKKEFGRTIADYTEAIRLDPTDAVPYNNRANVWATCPDEKHRDGKKAVESATRACELSKWSDPIYLNALAEASAGPGDFRRPRVAGKDPSLYGRILKADRRSRA